MRVLTVRQPWAFALVSLGKTVENRSTEWRYTGPLAIHAGAAFDTDALEDPALGDALRAHGWVSPPGVVFGSPAAWGATMHMGAVLGVVQMIGSHRAEPGCCPGNPWAQRDVKAHVVVRNPHPFQVPIGDVKGRLGPTTPRRALPMSTPCCTVNQWDRRHHAPACRLYQPTLRERLAAWLLRMVTR